MSHFKHRNIFFIAFFYWLIYSCAELARPGLVSTYVNLYALFGLLCIYACWIVITIPDNAGSEARRSEILLVSIGAGAILFMIGFPGVVGVVIPLAAIFLIAIAFLIL